MSYGALNGKTICRCSHVLRLSYALRKRATDLLKCGTAITPPILSEVYGNAHFGAIYTANALAEGAGSYGMATWLFSVVYEREIANGDDGAASASGSNGGADTSKDCFGRQCFALTAWVASATCVFSALLCMWLGRRTKARYDALRSGHH